MCVLSLGVSLFGVRWGAGVRRHSEKAGVSFLEPLNREEGAKGHRHLHVGGITVLMPGEESLAGSTLPHLDLCFAGNVLPQTSTWTLRDTESSCVTLLIRTWSPGPPAAWCGSNFLTPFLPGLQEHLDTQLTPQVTVICESQWNLLFLPGFRGRFGCDGSGFEAQVHDLLVIQETSVNAECLALRDGIE